GLGLGWPGGRDRPSEARRAEAADRLPDLRAADPRQAAVVSRLRGELAEAAPGARRDAALLRDLLRERPPGRLRTRRARHSRLRRRARNGRSLPQCTLFARG